MIDKLLEAAAKRPPAAFEEGVERSERPQADSGPVDSLTQAEPRTASARVGAERHAE